MGKGRWGSRGERGVSEQSLEPKRLGINTRNVRTQIEAIAIFLRGKEKAHRQAFAVVRVRATGSTTGWAITQRRLDAFSLRPKKHGMFQLLIRLVVSGSNVYKKFMCFERGQTVKN